VKVRLFIKPYCGWCDLARDWLDARGVDYETLDVIADDAAYEEMVKLSGQDLAPVLAADGRVLADFGPDQLPAFWKGLQND
jgi:glutaredoxin 3